MTENVIKCYALPVIKTEQWTTNFTILEEQNKVGNDKIRV